MTVLLVTVILLLSVNTVSAATWNSTSVIEKPTTTSSSVTVASPTLNQPLATSTPKSELASGSVSTTSVSTTVFTTAQITDASSRIKTFVETNKRLPNYVTINTQQVSMPQFLELVVKDLLLINTGSTGSVTLISVNSPNNPSENFVSGNINKAEYLDMASRIDAYITSNGLAPNYVTTSLGTMRYESLIYSYSKILNYYLTYKKLPNYVAVKPGAVQPSSSTSTATNLQQYLQSSANAQSNDPTIIALAKSITAGLTSDYDKAVALFNWVRDNITYSFYYGTKYGAVGTLSKGTGNCVDHAHLLAALSRSVGIPARYQYGNCKFSDGNFAHVWNQLYVNGKWYTADTISSKNTFGVINNWSLITLYGTYTQW